jgi:hypothetical protein
MARAAIRTPESDAGSILAAANDDKNSAVARELDRTARWGLWALPVWTMLLFVGTVDHQPDVRTDFAGFANYVTTTQFLLSHIVASIIGAGLGALGLLALFTFLAVRVRSRLAAVGLAMAVVGNVMLTAVFGMAAFAQPAIGRLYQAGGGEVAIATYQDMYGPPLASTAAGGILLLVIGVVALAVAITRSRALPAPAGIGLGVGIAVFGVVGAILNDFVQSIGAAVLVASTLWLAVSAWRAPAVERSKPSQHQLRARSAGQSIT